LTFDLSILLNVHDEDSYLQRTLRSTEEASRYARSLGALIELVVVLDRPSSSVQAQISEYRPDAFDGFQAIVVDNGSLGPSRNDGLRVSRGEYVTACDADDLVSFNMFAAALDSARREGPRTVVFPEYIFAFGREYWVGHYSGSDVVTPLRFVTHNPFPARFFGPRALFDEFQLADIPLGPGFAFEDWHLNCELLAGRVRFVTAPKTILFYRRRVASLSSAFDRVSLRVTRPSALFLPERYQELARSAVTDDAGSGAADAEGAAAHSRAVASFLDTALCQELVTPANRIDPAIDLRRYGPVGCWSTRCFPTRGGIAYFRLSEALGDSTPVTDVVFAADRPFTELVSYVGDVLHGLVRLGLARRVLLLAEAPGALAQYMGLMPPGTVAVAMHDLHPALDPAEVDALTVKAIHAVAGKARIHLGNSTYGARIWQRCSAVLTGNHAVVYRMGQYASDTSGRSFALDEDLNLISEKLGTIATLLAKDEATIVEDRRRVGTASAKWRLLPSPIEFAPELQIGRSIAHRLLLLENAGEATLGLSAELGTALTRRGLAVELEAWSDDPHASEHTAAPADLARFDGVLLAGAGRRLPDMVLDAMAAGLPVIASAITAARHPLLSGDTGWIVSCSAADPGFAEACATAVAELYADADSRHSKGRQARSAVEDRHRPDAFLQTLGELFANGAPA
jgi:hypothetical protein